MKFRQLPLNCILVFFSVYFPLLFYSTYVALISKISSSLDEINSLSKPQRIERKILLNSKKKKIKSINKGFLPLFYPIETRKFAKEYNIYPIGSIFNQNSYYCDEGYGLVEFKTDRFGLRNNDKKWENFRDQNIFVVGDSFAQGACVNEKNTMPQIIEDNTNITTFNLGFGGNSPYEYSAVLKNLVAPLIKFSNKKKYVIVIFYANDDRKNNESYEHLLNNSSEIISIGINNVIKPNVNYKNQLLKLLENNYPLSKEEILFQQGFKKKFKQTAIYDIFSLYPIRNLVKKSIQKTFNVPEDNPVQKTVNIPKDNFINIKNYSISERTIERLSKICNSNCKPIVTFIPNSLYWRPNRKSKQFKLELKSMSKNMNVTFIDAGKVIDPLNINDYAPKGPHLSIKGYKKVADLISIEIED